jgi:CRISPR/Cas system CSM-associated protein Csm3 (group 7 of RAMP superfamily)
MVERTFLHLGCKRKIICECSITLHEDIHIGVGEKFLPITIMKDADGTPIIPGSTLKGFFRSYMNRLLNGIYVNHGEVKGIDLRKLNDKEYSEKFEKASSEEKTKIIGNLSAISLLFGVSGFSSPIKFTDAKVIDKNVINVGKRAHVKIDVNKDVVENLIEMEAVCCRGGEKHFIFKVVFDELNDDVMREANLLFYYMMRMLMKGIKGFIGGWKSRGYGLATFKCNKIIIEAFENILKGLPPTEYVDESTLKFLNENIIKYGGE